MPRITSYLRTDERYLALRIVSVICTGIGAVLLLAGTVLLAFGLYALLAGMTSEPPPAGVPFGARPVNVSTLGHGLGGALSALWSLGFLVSGLQFLAIGTLFRLAIHVEENTRAAAQSLEKIRARLEPKGEDAGPLFLS